MHTNFGIFLRKLEIYLLHLNYDAFRSECLFDATVSNTTLSLRVITIIKMLKNFT